MNEKVPMSTFSFFDHPWVPARMYAPVSNTTIPAGHLVLMCVGDVCIQCGMRGRIRQALAFHRDNWHMEATLLSTAGFDRQMERAGVAMRRLGAAEPNAGSNYHLILS